MTDGFSHDRSRFRHKSELFQVDRDRFARGPNTRPRAEDESTPRPRPSADAPSKQEQPAGSNLSKTLESKKSLPPDSRGLESGRTKSDKRNNSVLAEIQKVAVNPKSVKKEQTDFHPSGFTGYSSRSSGKVVNQLISVLADTQAGALSETQARAIARYCHLSVFASLLFPILGPIACYALWRKFREQSSFVNHHGKEALNFQICLVFYLFIALVVAPDLWPVFYILAGLYVLAIAKKAQAGENARYMLIYRILG